MPGGENPGQQHGVPPHFVVSQQGSEIGSGDFEYG